ncbi:MAG: aminopeptidase N [Gemmatimonadota bacterium]
MAGGLTEAEAAARAALLQVGSYAVALDFGADPGVVSSRSDIRFSCREPGATGFADLTMAAMTGAALNGRPLGQAALAGGRLRLDGLAAANALTVSAQSPRSASGPALSWFTDPADGGTYVLGNCFPTYAPAVFCCFDQPDLRADFTLAVTAPAGWECIANGAVTSRPPAGEAGVWRFATVPGMKAYELALCAGPYVTQWADRYRGAGGEVGLSVRCRPGLAGSPGLAEIGGLVRRVLAFYERLLGVACPFPKYDIVFTPELGALAVSLPGVMMVSESLLHRMAGAGDDFVAVVLAHETAHLWFGCLVEGRWWDDLWLAEALATYLSYTAAQEELGQDAAWAEFIMREQAAAYRTDTLPGTEPVSAPVANADAALARPYPITYNKAASAIRQLAALIGDSALRAGLRSYLTTYGGGATSLADIIGCWSQASGRDLTGWADDWLRTPGVDILEPDLALAPGGTIGSVTISQQPPRRTHRVAIGVYGRAGGGLRRRDRISVTLTRGRATVPELAGAPAPDALILNDGGLTFARTRFGERSLAALTACGMDVGDPVTEAVCWNAAWDMVTTAEFSAAGFTGLVASRLGRGQPPGIAELLAHAATAADCYAPPAQRARLRERTAAAALAAAQRAQPGSRAQRALATGFAASAHSDSQLSLLRAWLAGTSLPSGLAASLDLRGQILAALAARDLATGADLDAYAAADPVSGTAHRATCLALRPDPAAKEAAWAEALASGQSRRLAQAHASGIWVPGQEDILRPYRERYFTEALPALAAHDPRTAQRLAEALFPAVLADAETIAATDAALAGDGIPPVARPVLLQQQAILRQVLTARSAAAAG